MGQKEQFPEYNSPFRYENHGRIYLTKRLLHARRTIVGTCRLFLWTTSGNNSTSYLHNKPDVIFLPVNPVEIWQVGVTG
jgi:hypothetical protein